MTNIKLICSNYDAFYKSALYPALRHLDRKLVLWATRKFKRLRGAAHWLFQIASKTTFLRLVQSGEREGERQ